MTPTLAARLQAGEVLYSGWLSTPSADAAAAMAAGDLDVVVVDLQHGFSGLETMASAVAAIHHAGAVPMVRIPLDDAGLAGRALDAGAAGIIAPMINTPEQAQSFAAATRYAPDGTRSWGPTRALPLYGMAPADYLRTSADWVVSFAMVETAEALSHLDAIAATDGLTGVFVGPNDLAISLTGGTSSAPTGPETLEACDKIARAARRAGCQAGIFANTPELARQYRDMGFTFIVIGNDIAFVTRGIAATRAVLAG